MPNPSTIQDLRSWTQGLSWKKDTEEAMAKTYVNANRSQMASFRCSACSVKPAFAAICRLRDRAVRPSQAHFAAMAARALIPTTDE
jgi:hypothetical protein